jgi:hypothetical protein
MQNVTIKTLLSIKENGIFSCRDIILKEDKTLPAIGNARIPDHLLICTIPKELQRPGLEREVEVKIHLLWVESDSSYHFTALVADTQDCEIYFVDVRPNDDDDNCRFIPMSEADILQFANKHNLYLKDVITLYKTDKRKLLDYQIYSPFTKRFCYIEIPCADRMIMYGVGLNDTRFWYVGWLGKLIIKDFYLIYGECTHEAYRRMVAECPSMHERCRQMERNRHLFTHFNVIHEKQKKHPKLVEIANGTKEPLSRFQASAFALAPKGISAQEYHGPAYHWMEAFFKEYKRQFYNQ